MWVWVYVCVCVRVCMPVCFRCVWLPVLGCCNGVFVRKHLSLSVPSELHLLSTALSFLHEHLRTHFPQMSFKCHFLTYNLLMDQQTVYNFEVITVLCYPNYLYLLTVFYITDND